MDRLEDTFKLQESHLPGTFYAMNRNDVVEYKIKSTLAPAVIKYRTWKIPESNFDLSASCSQNNLASPRCCKPCKKVTFIFVFIHSAYKRTCTVYTR